MKHPVRLTVVTHTRSGDQRETLEHRFTGHMVRRGDRTLLVYREPETDSLTHLLVEPGRVDLRRNGAVKSRMVLAPGLRHDFDYCHPLARVSMAVVTHSLSLAADGLTAEYDLYTGTERLASHRLVIRWQVLTD